MTAKGKAAGALVTPTTAHKNHDCTDHSTGAFLARNERILVPVKGLRHSFIAKRVEVCISDIRVRGYEVAQNDDGSFDAVHQYRTEHLADFPALEAFARSLGAKPYGAGGAA